MVTSCPDTQTLQFLHECENTLPVHNKSMFQEFQDTGGGISSLWRILQGKELEKGVFSWLLNSRNTVNMLKTCKMLDITE